MKRILIALSLVAIAGCGTDADVASRNLSKAAEQFEINRRIVFLNSITDSYILEIVGRCSVEYKSEYSEVTCRSGKDDFKKHTLRRSDNTTMVVEQLDYAKVGVYHYRLVFKPQSLIPDVDFKGELDALINDSGDKSP